MKAFTVGITAFFALNGATCGKSTTDDAAKEKPTPEVQLEGIDTGALTPREKKEWSRYVSEFLSPCASAPVPVAQCVKEKRDCVKCLPAARYLLRGVKEGMSREQIEKSYKNRFDADKVKTVPLDGSPTTGPASAPITIVEFADFECPHCALVAPMLDKVVEQRRSEVLFAFKFYPLPSHPHGELAARAAIAAWRQNRFWEMHHALFENRDHLEQSDIDGYAKALRLDLSRFHADMQSPETTARIERDRKSGEDLMISGTPSIFINGRLWDGFQDISEWITVELSGMGAPVASGAPPSAGGTPAKDAGKDASMPKAVGPK
jgi:protein-disulfide isomerase